MTLSTNNYADGSTVYSIGSAEGYTLSFSSGVISNKERVIDGVKYIQHSFPISHGSSGGPLINEYCEVIGVNTASNKEGQNINFAINIEELYAIPAETKLSMSEFYEKEGPYFETFIGDYMVKESEPNNTKSTAQKITINGTTINGNLNKQYDVDYFRILVHTGQTLNVLFVPEYSVDAVGIGCILLDYSGKGIAMASTKVVSGITLQALFYENTSASAQIFYVALFYGPEYIYKNTVCNYNLFLYSK